MIIRFLAQIVIGSVLASLLIMGMNAWIDLRREGEPASNWMEVSHLTVEPHLQGEDPAVLMDRVIKQRFTARWIAEVHKRQAPKNSFSTTCWGSGTNDYTLKKTLPQPLRLSWFMGKKCSLPKGEYKLCGTWIIRPTGYPKKIIRACSPVFLVN